MILDHFARFAVRDWIVWLGAGVSLSGPSRLPSGRTLTWFAVRETCGPLAARRIERLWAEINSLAADRSAAWPLGPIPRLETILGEVAAVEASTSVAGFAFLRGFESFARAPFNENHALAAALVSAGATVVTTNFDLCIEAAYAKRPGAGPLRSETVGNAVRYARTDGEPGEIWHVHGVASDVASLGATVAAVKEGLPAGFEQAMRRKLRHGAALAFLGYSASDSFDVTPFFEQLAPADTTGSFAAFVQHPGEEAPDNARRLLHAFGGRAETLDTTTALRGLAAHAGCVAGEAEEGPFDWGNEFRFRTRLDGLHGVRGYLVCRLANALGINVHLIHRSALAGAERRAALFEPQAFHGTMAVAYRPIGDATQERRHDEAVKKTEADMLGFLYAQGRLEEARERALSIRKLLEITRGGPAELGWDVYTSMSVHCRIEVMQWLRGNASKPDAADRRHLASLIRIAHRLGKRPYQGVRYINQIATARRFGFLFQALVKGREDVDAVADVLRLYGDAASVGGFISTWRDLAIARFFLLRCHRQWRMFIPALAAATRSLRLARAAGDRASTRRATLLMARIAAFPV